MLLRRPLTPRRSRGFPLSASQLCKSRKGRGRVFAFCLLPSAICPALTGCGPDAPRHLSGVLRFEAPAGEHRSGALGYDMTPPAFGDHNALWQSCGVYAQPIHAEYALHSLSHGAVWLTYKGLPAAAVGQLEALAEGQKILLSPEPEQSAPVIVTAWNAQLEAQQADDPRLAQFVAAFVDAETAPEAGKSCAAGHEGMRQGQQR